MRAGTILWFASAFWLALAPLVGGRADTSGDALSEADQDFQKALSIWGDGRSVEAESLLNKALALRQAALGPSHPKVAEVVGRLGAIDYNRANYAAAEIKFRQAYEIDLQTLGLRRLETAYAMGDLGAALREEHQYDEARGSWKSRSPCGESCCRRTISRLPAA
jgi:tetratricopeptide (TPR) repeat protein